MLLSVRGWRPEIPLNILQVHSTALTAKIPQPETLLVLGPRNPEKVLKVGYM